jgi:hypothetical protein
MRRLSFQSQLTEAVAGFSDWDLDAFVWGDWHGDEQVGDKHIERPPIAVLDARALPRWRSSAKANHRLPCSVARSGGRGCRVRIGRCSRH